MNRCKASNCSNYANKKREFYCNSCADKFQINFNNNGIMNCFNSICPFKNEDQIPKWNANFLPQNKDIELPAGFTGIVDKMPEIGDHVITLVGVGCWMTNSYERVYGIVDGNYKIHFACDSIYSVRRNDFVVIS